MPTDHDLAERDGYIERVRSKAPREAVFWALYYNRARAWRAHCPPIDPAQLLHDLEASALGDCMAHAEALFRSEVALGAAYFEYAGHPRTFDEEWARFKGLNPGFSDDVYDAVLRLGILAMR